MSKKKLITCIFCGDENVPSSGEDWIPKWLAKKLAYFAEERHPGKQAVYTEYTYDSADKFSQDMSEGTPGERGNAKPRVRGSTPLGEKLPDVCLKCNGGWMSRLEIAVNPIMEGFLSGRPKNLDPYDEFIFSTWILKICLAYDASFTNRYISNDMGTHRLYAIAMPMVYDHFSIGHDPDYTSEGARVEMRSPRMLVTWPDGDQFIAVQFHFQFEHLIVRALIHCFVNPFEGRPGLRLPLNSPHHIEIWPQRRRFWWPTESALHSARVTEEPVSDATDESEIEPL